MSVSIKDNSSGFDRLMRELKSAGNKEVVAGIQQGAVNDGVQVAEYAALNEFGHMRTPSRPFMRSYFDSERDALEQFSRNGITQVALGNATFDQFLNASGVKLVDGIKKSINSGKWTPNAPYTIAKKKSNKPLIDTGVMLSSVTFVINAYGTSK
ncbi:conserved hypothetical protein [Erwinia phage phiEt88]|uniref:tail completion or Neck1 protein n=1 Tax=Erwinia phage phiEt88 TaxID=925984 RepID=UPI0001F1FC5C|nr:tail completion or Neck1 protein [Erwinia phage phiEt88]CBX44523.1 conserved hypothetical protein [Erwinia phage phiEt88]